MDGVELVMLTAEKLNDHDRQNIQEYFKCEIFDYYGSTEQSIFIYRPSDKEYYEVSNLTGYLEVRKEDGCLASDGEEGELLVTSYTSSYTPLVRYQIGDRCVVHRQIVLEDGSLHYTLKEIIGRNEESFRTRDGRIVSRFSLVLKFLPNSILRAQLFLSEKSNEIKVVYVADVDIKTYEFDRFVSKISEMVGLGYAFSFDRVKDLTRDLSGKIRTVFVKKMTYRVLYIVPSLDMGGAEMLLVNWLNLCERAPAHFKFELLIVGQKAGLLPMIHNSNIVVHHFAATKLNYLSKLPDVVKLVFELKPHIIHSHLFKANILARFLKVFYVSAKVVNHYHGLYLYG